MNRKSPHTQEAEEPLLEEELNDNTSEKNNSYWVSMIFLILIGIVLFVLGKAIKVIKKTPKRELRRKYQVSFKTFNKWIEIFCHSAIDYEEYKNRRLLSDTDIAKIVSILGEPQNGISVYSKREIVEKAGTSYNALRYEIDMNPELYGITPSVFKSLDYYPPKIGEHFIRCLVEYSRSIPS
jgi:hypothetical protein